MIVSEAEQWLLEDCGGNGRFHGEMRETLREMIYLIQISSIWFFNKVEAH